MPHLGRLLLNLPQGKRHHKRRALHTYFIQKKMVSREIVVLTIAKDGRSGAVSASEGDSRSHVVVKEGKRGVGENLNGVTQHLRGVEFPDEFGVCLV